VILAGLILTFKANSFWTYALLMGTSGISVTKLQAPAVGGAPATRTQRLINGHPAKYTDPVIPVGAQEVYEARCCHSVPHAACVPFNHAFSLPHFQQLLHLKVLTMAFLV